MSTPHIYGHDQSGRPVTDVEIERYAAEAEAGYDVDVLIERRGARELPRLNVEQIAIDAMLDPALRDELVARATADGTTTSEIIREALRRYLRAPHPGLSRALRANAPVRATVRAAANPGVRTSVRDVPPSRAVRLTAAERLLMRYSPPPAGHGTRVASVSAKWVDKVGEVVIAGDQVIGGGWRASVMR